MSLDITWKGSPNKDGENYRKPIVRIIIHWFGVGTLTSADARFQNPDAKASAHYGVSGKKVYQWVKEDEVAWHAGNYPINQESIGIEHDATTDHNLSEESYKTSAELISQICARYNIPLDRDHIEPHNKYSATQCPGTIDIGKLINLAKEFSGGEADPCASIREVLEGVRESRDKHRRESQEKSEKIIGLETELSNREEQVDRLKADIVVEKEINTSLTKQIASGSQEMEQVIQIWTKRLSDKQDEVDKFASEKGGLEIENAQLKQQIDDLNTQPREITFGEAVAKIISVIKFWGRK